MLQPHNTLYVVATFRIMVIKYNYKLAFVIYSKDIPRLGQFLRGQGYFCLYLLKVIVSTDLAIFYHCEILLVLMTHYIHAGK